MAGMHRWMPRLIMLIVGAASLGATIPAMAASRLHTEIAGTVITSRLAGEPAGYGTNVEFLQRNALPEKELSRTRSAASVHFLGSSGRKLLAASNSWTTERDRQLPWRKLFGFVAASIGGLYAVTKAARSVTSPLLGRIIYLAFFCGIFLFAYTSHAESLMTTCCSMKERVLDLLEHADMPTLPTVSAN